MMAPVASSSVAPQQPAAGGGMGDVIALMHEQQRQNMKMLETMVRKMGHRHDRVCMISSLLPYTSWDTTDTVGITTRYTTSWIV